MRTLYKVLTTVVVVTSLGTALGLVAPSVALGADFDYYVELTGPFVDNPSVGTGVGLVIGNLGNVTGPNFEVYFNVYSAGRTVCQVGSSSIPPMTPGIHINPFMFKLSYPVPAVRKGVRERDQATIVPPPTQYTVEAFVRRNNPNTPDGNSGNDYQKKTFSFKGGGVSSCVKLLPSQ